MAPCNQSVIYFYQEAPHGEEFETGMRSDDRHLENLRVLFCREFK